ncbi:hypothetical protein [Dysgonomonas macrotermitis]|uniref:C1q domain-containing protein n=1 Tax=Dysgonomonas macrotermitis TaxID=1346286 RepID=A0A1M5J537_9BACT|nr:hypothetical protein [Dysgonomonas macrotermitis]SHG35686.1 hypothetical protein SAMN05444362_12211 [Dysgonomonas macrotermitis]
MKNKKRYLLILCLVSITTLQAQVGINTQNPLGIFHVDPLANTSGTTSSPLNDSDDVIIDNKGNMGIGTATPVTKLDIVSATPGAIRIVDGNEGEGKILSSIDGTGVATWQNVTGSWSAALTGGELPYTSVIGYRDIKSFSGAFTSQAGIGAADIVNGSIKIPYDGVYRICIYATSLMNRYSGYYIAGFFIVYQNSVKIWAPHNLGNTNISNEKQVSYMSFAQLNKDDIITIAGVETITEYSNGVKDLTLLVEFVQ